MTTNQIGIDFARQFFTCLNGNPGELWKFFSRTEDAVFTHEEEERRDRSITATGFESIKESLPLLKLESCKVGKLNMVPTQALLGKSVLVVTTGTWVESPLPPRRFVSTFCLAPRVPNSDRDYSVRNAVISVLACDQDRVQRNSNPVSPPPLMEKDAQKGSINSKKADCIEASTPSPASTETLAKDSKATEQAYSSDTKAQSSSSSSSSSSTSAASFPSEASPVGSNEPPESDKKTPVAAGKAALAPERRSYRTAALAAANVNSAPPASSGPSSGRRRENSENKKNSNSGRTAGGGKGKAVRSPHQQRHENGKPSNGGQTSETVTASRKDTGRGSPSTQPNKASGRSKRSSKGNSERQRGRGGGGGTAAAGGASGGSSSMTDRDALALYVRNVHTLATEDDLKAYFEGFGPVRSVHIERKKNVAFVNYFRIQNVEVALAATTQKPVLIQGKKILVEPKKPSNRTRRKRD